MARSMIERIYGEHNCVEAVADDPNSIMDSVVELIEKTINQVEQAARDNEGRDSISRRPPDTNDPIDDPGVISPRTLDNGALPISLSAEGREPASAPEARGMPANAIGTPVRILSRKVAEKRPAFALDASTTAAPNGQNSFGDRFGNWTSSLTGITPRNLNLSLQAVELRRPLEKPMPLWTTPSELMNNSPASGNGDRSWIATLAGGASDNPAPPRQTGGNNPVRYLSQRIVDQPQPSAFGTGVPAVPFTPFDDRSFSGGLAGRTAALTGIDPDNPGQPVAEPGGLLARLLAAQR
jgi:hypothetical protein